MNQKFTVRFSLTDIRGVIAWESRIIKNKTEEEIEEEIQKLYPQEYWTIQSIEFEEHIEADPEEQIERQSAFEEV